MSPLGQQRRVRGAAGHIAADGHRAKRSAMITLAAREDAEASGLAAFEVKLARELDGGFRGFRAAGSEIDAAILEIGRREREEACGEFLRRGRMELRSMGKGELRGLLGHGAADFRDAVADVNDGGLAGGVQEPAAVGGEKPGAFAANSDGKGFAKIARKKRRVWWHACSLSDCSRGGRFALRRAAEQHGGAGVGCAWSSGGGALGIARES